MKIKLIPVPSLKLFLYLLIISNLSINCSSQPKKLQNKLDGDTGKMFILGVNSALKDEQVEIAKKIFASELMKEKGEDGVIKIFEAIKSTLGELQYHSDEFTGGTEEFPRRIMHLFAKDKNQKWKDIQFIMSTSEPDKILQLAFIADVTEPVYLPNGSIEQKITLDWLNNYIDKLNKIDGFYGSIMITKGRNILLEKYSGYSNPEKNIPFSSQTLFNMASGSKMFTAISIAKLVSSGKINYTDKIEKYFPDFKDKNKISKVTIRHLLNHTSGIAEYWTEPNSEIISSFSDASQYLPLIYSEGFSFEPGSECGYSNSNFMLLGLIIEKESGESYYDYVLKNILQPAGMDETGFYYRNAEKNLAQPLVKSGENWNSVNGNPNSRGTSAGGCYTTLNDMVKFSNAIKNNVLLTSEIFNELIKDQTTGIKDAFGYGYGFELNRYGKNGIAYGHGGITKGVNFEYRYFPEFDITLVICCNQDNGAFDDLKKNSVKLITGDR